VVRPAPGLTIEQQLEEVVIRLLVWGEARGESAVGKLAVLWVVHNRALLRDTSLKTEALRDRQFSCFNADDPNREKLLKAHELDPAGWKACDAICELYAAHLTTDPTKGATHYYVAAMKNPPTWGRGHHGWVETFEEGHHVFGRAA